MPTTTGSAKASPRTVTERQLKKCYRGDRAILDEQCNFPESRCMNRIRLAVFSISVITLMTELLLTRILDYLMDAHMAYLVITCAMFSFGLSGIYSTLIRVPSDSNQRYFAAFFLVLAISILALLPALNFLPFDVKQLSGSPRFQTVAFGILYVAISIPFFISGLFINRIFATYAARIQSLYFLDLTGAAFGCVAFLPFLPGVGPGSLLFCAAGVALLTSALFCRRWFASAIFVASGAIVLIIPFAYSSAYLDIRQSDRAAEIGSRIQSARKLEFARWDPVARIEVVDVENDVIKKLTPPNHSNKVILFDGGKQASPIFPFDGNFTELRNNIGTLVKAHFILVDNLASHYLKRDTGHRVLVIGIGGGQEIKAALMYGAGHVDAVDMVGTVIELGQKTYAAFNGDIFNNPKVHSYVAEGRSFLHSTSTKYDIIQIISNHTTSSIAAGQGAVNPVYLQTSDAYREYFDHLTDNGILHIHHLSYPRMVTTAAKAWKEMGRTDFQKHVVVIAKGEQDIMKAYLVKMRPWTAEELRDLTSWLYGTFTEDTKNYSIVENPLHPERSFLSNEFYSGHISTDLAARLDYRVTPATDDRPYFGFLRKHLGPVEAKADKFMDYGTAWVLNPHGSALLTRDIFHLVITGAMSLFFSALFIVAPL